MLEINLDVNSSQSEIDAYENSFKKGNWLVRYHASWCGHCINMSQEWSDFVSNNKNKKVKIISIEQEAMDRLKRKPQNFRGFPSIIFFKDGQFISEFSDDRTEKNFHKFIKKESNINNKKKSNKKRKQSSTRKRLKLSQKL